MAGFRELLTISATIYYNFKPFSWMTTLFSVVVL